MKKLNFTLLFSLVCLAAFAQQSTIKKDAQAMADATVKGDMAKTLSYIYPKVLAQWGGKDQLLKNSNNFTARLQSSGIGINSIVAGDPGKMQLLGNREFSLINTRISVNSNGAPMSNNLVVLAISEDKGHKWYFITAGMVSDDNLYRMFPEIKGKISLPKPSIPMMPGKGN